MFFKIVVSEVVIHSFFNEQHEVKTDFGFADYKILGLFFFSAKGRFKIVEPIEFSIGSYFFCYLAQVTLSLNT